MRKQSSFFLFFFLLSQQIFSQNIDQIINVNEVRRIETFLAADELKGRRTFSPEIDKAADFIANEFKAAGLQTLNNNGSYLQSFVMVQPKFISASGVLDGVQMETRNLIVVTCKPELQLNEGSG
ncbi:MAG: hypothetical protein B7Z54_06295, partial [Sphingobacteriales bacterium 12-47-4]